MSLNHACPDRPVPAIASSARLLGEVRLGAGAVLAQGLVVRAHSGTIEIGHHSAVLENRVVVGWPASPVRIGQRTVFGHRCQVIGATVGDLCEICNGAILMPGARLSDGVIFGEGALIPSTPPSPPRRSWSDGPPGCCAPLHRPTRTGWPGSAITSLS